MENINFLYIDDKIDPHVTRYFNKDIQLDGIIFNVDQYKFDPKIDNYKTLLNDKRVLSADLIIIDSMLFENANVGETKIAGEEIQLIFRKFLPYKEVLVISQNGKNDALGILGKLRTSEETDYINFFNRDWKPKISDLVTKIINTRNRFNILNQNKNIETVLREKIDNTFNGISQYEELSKSDIDKCISLFNEIKGLCEHEGL